MLWRFDNEMVERYREIAHAMAKHVALFCEEHGWEYSISVTNPRNKGPIKRFLLEVEESEWVSLDRHGKQRLLQPRYTVICTNCTSLSLKEVVHRHRGKQEQENAQKGPLIDMDLHPVIKNVIRIAGKLVFHARRYVLKLSKVSLRLDLKRPAEGL